MDFPSSSDSESGSEDEKTSHDGDLRGQQGEVRKDGTEQYDGGSTSEVGTKEEDEISSVMDSTSRHKGNRFLEDDSDLEDQKEAEIQGSSSDEEEGEGGGVLSITPGGDDKKTSGVKRRISSDIEEEEEGEGDQEIIATKKRKIDSEGEEGEGGESDGNVPSNHERSGVGEESEEEGSDDGRGLEGSGEVEKEDGGLDVQVEEAELVEEGEGREEEEERGGREEQGSDEEVEDRGISDWDLMMQRRKDAMARSRRKKKRDGDLTVNDDHIMALIQKMRRATSEDRQLNLAHKAATKKIQLLPTVMGHLKKADLQTTFIECGILSALAEWLTPLPDHSLPHLKIREAILDTLKSFPIPDGSILKSSKIGKAVMLVYRHPKESRRNREKAGKIINEWARPIFGLASDFKSMTRDEREERDYANLSQEARRRISAGERRPSQEEDTEQPQKPGDKGWVGRARVPMPSTKGYVVRPKWNAEFDFKKSVGKKTLNRYEKHVRKKKQEKMQSKTTHAVPLSVEGRKMPL